MTWPLTPDDQWDLAHAFLNVEEMQRREGRDLCVVLLEETLGRRLIVRRDDRALTDMMHLVRSCLAYPGAIRTLAAIVEQLSGGSRAMGRLNELIDRLFPEPLLTPRERRDLHRIVHGPGGWPDRADRALIGDLYRRAAGPLGPPPPGDTGDLRMVIAHLEELTTGPDGVPPLLVFVEGLAVHATGPAADELRDWAERLAARLGLEPEVGRAVRERTALALEGPAPVLTATGPCSYLVIEFRPDAVTTDHYLTSAWLQFDGEHGAMLRCDDEDPLPRRALGRVIEELLADQRVANRPHTDLVIEFVLPRELLGTEFDQYPVTIEGLTRRLGIEFPIVVRSFERMRSRALHHNWRRRWNRLRDDPARARLCRVGQRRPAEEHELLYSSLLEDSSVGVAMPFPPRPERGNASDELWIGLHAGMPIAVWCRRERKPDGFFTEIQQLWDQGVLALPQNVLRLRRKALYALREAPADDHLGFHLTLMFDDADRLPEPYIRLSAPA